MDRWRRGHSHASHDRGAQLSLLTTTTASPGVGVNTIVESTTDSGVEVRRVTTEWATVITPGVTLRTALFQITKRVTIISEWEPYIYYLYPNGYATLDDTLPANGEPPIQIPSTQLNARTTRTEALVGTPSALSGGYAWYQGGQYREQFATLRLVEELFEVYTWNVDCTMASAYVTRWQSYSPLDPAGDEYADGSIRADAVYPFPGVILVAEDRTTWPSVRRNIAQVGVGIPIFSRWYQDAPGSEAYGVVSVDSTLADISSFAEAGDVAQTGSPLVPQIHEEVMMVEYDATDASGYTERTESPALLPYPESEDELIAVAKRRIRRACSDTLDISHNAIPFLRVGDHVTVTNHARSLIDADAYVQKITRTFNVLNGAARQVTTVKIPPSWI